MLSLALAALAAAAQVPSAPQRPALPEAAQLREQIAARDAELFDLLFNRCEPERMRALLAPDLEFYHDKGGLVRGADAFVADYARFCAERQAPNAWRSRRALIPESLIVDPVPGIGAIEAGEHLFYERQGEGPERLAGRARFAQVWLLGEDGQWRLSRVLSYSHGPAP